MILSWKAVVLRWGCRGCKRTPKSWFADDLSKSPENPGKNSSQRCLASKNGAQGLHKNLFFEDLFMDVTPKRDLHDLCGRKFVGKSCTKNFSGKFEQIRAKSFAKICLLLHRWWKGTSAPVTPLLKGQKGKCPRHVSILRLPCAYYSARTLFTRCKLQCVIAMNINYQRSPKTEQFKTAKVSGNALKQGSRTHSVLRQRSSQLQKYKAARMSGRIAIMKVSGWDGGHPGLTVGNLVNYTKIENTDEVGKKPLFLLCGCCTYNY